LIFIDETSTNTRLTKRAGWSPEGERYRTHVPFGSWKTQTFVAGLRCHGMVAPWIVDAPMNTARFEFYIETQLAPQLSPGDIVIRDNVAFHKSPRAAELVRRARRLDARATGILARPQPHRDGVRETQGPAQKARCTLLRRHLRRTQGHLRPLRPSPMQKLLQSRRI
jgi:hypothetical protein